MSAGDYWERFRSAMDEAMRESAEAITGEDIPTDEEIAAESEAARDEMHEVAARRERERRDKRARYASYLALGLAGAAGLGLIIYAGTRRGKR